jgi:hypothetical protein
MSDYDEFQQWNNEIHATTKRQRETVQRLNDLTPENNGCVHAGEVDAEPAELCGIDTAHGAGTVVFMLDGELTELCPECGVNVVGMMAQDATPGDVIDVEVYR